MQIVQALVRRIGLILKVLVQEMLLGSACFEFIMVLLVASLIGGAIGFTMVEVSMDAAWEYYQRVGLNTLFTSVTIMILIAALTVGFKTINAARMNPVKNLRMNKNPFVEFKILLLTLAIL